MKQIKLSNGGVALISDHQYDRVAEFTWRKAWIRDRWYARRGTDNALLHRFIMNVTDPNILVDHRDNDGLNCQDDNLRVCSRAQNQQNRKVNRNNGSGYKGVRRDKKNRKYKVQIIVDGHAVHAGYFDDPVEAAKAYDIAARRYFGEFAKTNFL